MYRLRSSLYLIFYLITYRYEICAGQNLVYPGQAKSERDLSTCKPYEICSIVHKRFWYDNQVERFCRCDQQECSIGWTDLKDKYTMTINNRAQMKFCEPITELPNCLQNATTFLHVVNETVTETHNNTLVENYKIRSKAECYCPSRTSWIPHAYQQNPSTVTSSSYRCSELPKCNPQEFCGFERTDFYATYYKCSCPVGHLCIRQNESVTSINEIFYRGPAYTTYCSAYPLPKFSVDTNTN